MDTIKWLFQKAFENDYNISISKPKKGNAVSIKVSKTLSSGKKLEEVYDIDEITLNRAEAGTVGTIVKAIFDRITEEEKYDKHDTRPNRAKA